VRIQIWETNICHHRTYPVSLCKAPSNYAVDTRPAPLKGTLRAWFVVEMEMTRTHPRPDDLPFSFFFFFWDFHFTEKREIRCMDLGKTALGNWKAQQGGCTHIQVRSLIRSYSTVVCAISQGGRTFSPSAPLFFFFSLQFFNEINDLK
jgi:hypothetical protein